MFEKFLRTNAGDFRQRYRGTFGFFTSPGKKRILVKLVDVNIDTGNGYVSFEDERGVSYRLNIDASDDVGFDFIPPKTQWHNTENGLFLVRRVPARQWSRGICSNNTTIFGVGSKPYTVDFFSLSSIFEKAISLEQAMKNSDDFCLSPQFAVSLKRNLLYCFDATIGKVAKVDHGFQVMLDDPELFGVEVRDAFNRVSLPLEIK